MQRPYEKQANESLKAFEAFAVYRDLQPQERSLQSVYRKLGKSVALIKRWSAKYHWVQRSAAWDAELDRAKRKRNLAMVEATAERHAAQAMTAADASLASVLTLWQKLAKNPRYLEDLEPEELVALAILAARTLAMVHRAEAEARGALPLPD